MWNVVGGMIWTESLLLLGHFLGASVPSIDKYILPGVVVIVVLSVIPIIREVMKAEGRRSAPGSTTGMSPKTSRPSLSGDSYR